MSAGRQMWPNRVVRLRDAGFHVGVDIGWNSIGVLDQQTGIVYVGTASEGGSFKGNLVGDVEFHLDMREDVP